MTPKQYAELLEYIKANNSWGDKMYEINIERNRLCGIPVGSGITHLHKNYEPKEKDGGQE